MSAPAAVAVEVSDPVTSPVGGYNLYPVHDSLCLLDAHLIFQPLLFSLGVIPQQMVSNVGASSGEYVLHWRNVAH